MIWYSSNEHLQRPVKRSISLVFAHGCGLHLLIAGQTDFDSSFSL